MRQEYEMTEEDHEKIVKASQPVMAIALQCGPLRSPQENANAAWRELGERMGFKYMTVKPSDRGVRFFTAEASDDN